MVIEYKQNIEFYNFNFGFQYLHLDNQIILFVILVIQKLSFSRNLAELISFDG